MPYRNSSSSKQTITYLYLPTEVALDPTKTLLSVTLPSTVTGGQLHIFAVGTGSILNNLGSSNDSQPGSANLDTIHSSYSLQAMENAGIVSGQPVVFDGFNFLWPASYGTIADNYQAAGQTISVTPVVNATTLGFIGSATNTGSSGVNSGTATITYTDGSTQTFTLSLTDWWSATAQSGNQIVATFNTINTPTGPRAGTYHIYEAETSLQAGKTIQSVTLPSTISSGQMHIFSISTRSADNNIGISDDNNTTEANFDGGGSSYSAQDFSDPNGPGWNPGDTLTYQGINYVWPGVPSGQSDNYAQWANDPCHPGRGCYYHWLCRFR